MPWDQAKVDKWYNENLQRGASKTQLDAIVQQKQADFIVKQGGIQATDIPTDSVQLRALTQQVSKGAYETPKSAAEKKSEKEFTSAMNLIDELEGLFVEAGGGQLGTGVEARVRGAGESLKGALGYSDAADTYNDARKGFTAALKSVVGETGVLTDKDIKRIQALIPKLGATPGEAVKNYDLLRSQVAAKFGQDPSEGKLEQAGVEAQDPNLMRELSNLLFRPQKEAIQSGLQEPYTVGERAVSANPLLGLLTSERYREEIAPAGIDLYAKLGIGKMAAGGLGKGKALLSPRKAIASKQKELAKEVGKINTSKIVKAGRDYAKIDPEAAKISEKILPTIEKNTDLTTLLKKMRVWGKAYTQAGKVGKSQKAGFYDALYRKGREEIARVAPEVARQTDLMRLTFTLPKATQKIAWNALKFSALGRLLGI